MFTYINLILSRSLTYWRYYVYCADVVFGTVFIAVTYYCWRDFARAFQSQQNKTST